tara:strand:+ start:420 stop:710 length:291 start_codon:yes stop_codon:yes gene_type:complete
MYPIEAKTEATPNAISFLDSSKSNLKIKYLEKITENKNINVIAFDSVNATKETRILFSGKRFNEKIIKPMLNIKEDIFMMTEVIANLKILKNPRRY